MAILKKEIKSNFTVVHNNFLQDTKLSINARGLLMTMLSMKENWNFSIKGLAGILPDGERKISSTLNELEELGYLIRIRKYKNGKIVDWEYTFSDEPIINGGKTVENSVLTHSNALVPTPGTEQEKSPVPASGVEQQNLYLQNVDVENVDVQNSGYYKIPYNQILSNQISVNQSLIAGTKKSEKVFNTFNNSEYKLAYKKAHEQINSEILLDEKDDTGQALHTQYEIHEVTDLMAWVSITNKPKLKINGGSFNIDKVREEFSRLEEKHIRYVISCMRANAERIRNRRGYLLSCLFNAPNNIEYKESQHED